MEMPIPTMIRTKMMEGMRKGNGSENVIDGGTRAQKETTTPGE